MDVQERGCGCTITYPLEATSQTPDGRIARCCTHEAAFTMLKALIGVQQQRRGWRLELLDAIASDMLANVSVTDAEAALIDTLITATGDRRLGVTPFFGGVAGSVVTVV